MRGEGLSLLSYNTAKQLINCIPHQVSLESYGHLVQSPAPGRRPVVSWPHGLPSQGHSVSPGWNTNVQMEAVLSTNNVITRSSLLVNNSLKKKKVRFKATARTCLNNAFSQWEVREAVPHSPGSARGAQMTEPSSFGPGDGALRVSEGSAHLLPIPYCGSSATLSTPV